MTTLKITVPLPDKCLHPNARPHWAKKAKATKSARWRAYSAAMIAYDEVGWREAPLWPKATIRAVFYVKDRRGVAADEDGRVASLKATCDGLGDAALIENDRGLTWLSPPITHEIDKLRPRVELFVTKFTEEALP